MNWQMITEVEEKFEMLLLPSPKDSNKLEDTSIDEHSQASVLAGLINKLNGACSYLNDHPNPKKFNKTLTCRIKSREEKLNLRKLISQNVTRTPMTSTSKEMKTKIPEATHIVVGVTYGAEAYCVLTQDLEDNSLSTLSKKLNDSLATKKNLTPFKKLLSEEEQNWLSTVNCRMYADLQVSADRNCDFSDFYKHCLFLIEQNQKSSVRNSKAVPVTIRLCPLKHVTRLVRGICTVVEYREVDNKLMTRYLHLWSEFEKIEGRAEFNRNQKSKVSQSTFRQFLSVIVRYKELLKKSLKQCVLEARLMPDGNDTKLEQVIDIAEKNSLFNPSKLNGWLDCKEEESEIVSKLTTVTGVTFLESNAQLMKKLEDSFTVKHTLVLCVPPLSEQGLLESITNYVDANTELVLFDGVVKEEENLPIVQQKKKIVFSNIRELTDHVNNNKNLENQIQFFITYDQSNVTGPGCSYSLYESDALIKANLYRLPSPPTGLRINHKAAVNSSSPIHVEWDYEDLGYPSCHFLIQFRLKGQSDESWAQRRTTKPGETQTTIMTEYQSAMEIRVAADTCIGRSKFSAIVDTDFECPNTTNESQRAVTNSTSKIEEQIPVKRHMVAVVTAIPATIPTAKAAVAVSTDIDERGAKPKMSPSVANSKGIETPKLVFPQTQQKKPQAKPTANVKASIRPAKIILKTPEGNPVPYAETLREHCSQIGTRNGKDLYAVPLKEVKNSSESGKRFVFNGVDSKRNKEMQRKTILVIGATGSGKTTWINAMINYIFNVQWADSFRFQLIQEQTVGQSQANSQTSHITAYDIHHSEGFRIPFSLTIVDTPGYGDTKGLIRDKEITEMISQFFKDKNGIQELDIIGFVAQASLPRLTPIQAYIFDAILSIFGKDVKENINFLLNFADSQIPPVLSAIVEANLPCLKDPNSGHPLYHKFNNTGFFCSTSGDNKFNRSFWDMGMRNFEKFFNVLATMTTRSLSLTKEVLDERKHLEAMVDGLQQQNKFGLAKMEEMRKTKQIIENCRNRIKGNENVKIEVTVPERENIPPGLYVTICNKCHVTCHYPCTIPNDDNKANCRAMNPFTWNKDSRTCRICPEKCHWKVHSNQTYKWKYVKQKKLTSAIAIKEKYEKELKRKLTAEELIEVLQKEIDANDKDVLERVNTITHSIKRLEEIALRPNPFSTPQYIDLIIVAEQQEKQPGFNERIESWRKLRQMALIMNNEELHQFRVGQSIDHPVDDAAPNDNDTLSPDQRRFEDLFN